MLRRFVPIVLVAVALAGCGDDKNEPSAASSSSSSTTQTTAESTTTTTAPTTTTTVAGLSESSPLRFDGIGPIKVGMTLTEAKAAVGKPMPVDENSPTDVCNFAKVQGGPAGLSFMVERAKPTDPWHIARVDVDGGKIVTVSGVGIGATEDEVKKAYSGEGKSGTLQVEPHKYVEGGHNITYDVDGPQGNLLLFETDGKKVTQFRSGQQVPVEYVEGCA
jgi:hypothetical protein